VIIADMRSSMVAAENQRRPSAAPVDLILGRGRCGLVKSLARKRLEST
jgi:hypothetical protein